MAVKRGFKKTGVKWRGGNFQKKLGKGKLDKKTYDDRAFTSGLVGDYTSTNFTPTTPSQRFKNSTDEKIRFTSAALSSISLARDSAKAFNISESMRMPLRSISNKHLS